MLIQFLLELLKTLKVSCWAKMKLHLNLKLAVFMCITSWCTVNAGKLNLLNQPMGVYHPLNKSKASLTNHLQHIESLKPPKKSMYQAKVTDDSKRYNDLILDLGTIYESKHFSIHYAKTGAQAIDTTDLDSNQIPDYIELVAGGLEEAWALYYHKNNFVKPRWKWTTNYPIFLRKINSDSYGLTDALGLAGDHPETIFKEKTGYYSYITLRNEYSSSDFENPTMALLSTAVHELFHAIQIGINFSHDTWWLEGLATSMEYELYGDEADNTIYLDSYWPYPDISIAYNPSSEHGDYVDVIRYYGAWPFFSYLDQRFGMQIAENMVEKAAQIPETISLVKESIFEFDSLTLDDVHHDFWASYLLDPDVDGNSNDTNDVLQKAGGTTSVSSPEFEGELIENQLWDSQLDGNGILFGESVDFFKVSTLLNLEFTLTSGDSVLARLFNYDYEILKEKKVVEGQTAYFDNYKQAPGFFSIYNLSKPAQNSQYKMLVQKMSTVEFLENISVSFTKSSLTLKSDVDLKGMKVQFISCQGQVLQQEKATIEKGIGLVKLPNLTPGLYYFHFTLNGKSRLSPVLVGF